MSTFMVFFFFFFGLLLIIKGGDWFVDASSWIARVSGIPQFIVGATIVSIATTLPEILVSVMAAVEGNVTMATGNAIGSVTANTGMILALSLIFMPVAINRKKYMTKFIILIASIILLWAFSLKGSLSIFASVILFICFVAFIVENVFDAKMDISSQKAEEKEPTDKKTVIKNIILFILGAVGLFVGSRLLVDNGSLIATDILHIDERIVSLTMVAIGTSLPELVTTITAIVKKQSSLSVGNIVGANIIDILLILPICAFVSGGSLPVASSTIMIDLPVCFAVTLISLIPPMIFKKFYRWQGIANLIIYISYLVYVCFFGVH